MDVKEDGRFRSSFFYHVRKILHTKLFLPAKLLWAKEMWDRSRWVEAGIGNVVGSRKILSELLYLQKKGY